MPSSLLCAAIAGAGARPVEVQVDLSLGLPGFHLVGLPDHACNDARVRVQTALRNSGYRLPQKKVTVNLAPGDLRKEGAGFDLAIALGVLVAAGLITPAESPPLVVGELALSGEIMPVRGVLPIALEARRMGVTSMIVPQDNAAEGALVQELRVYGADNLVEAAELFSGMSGKPPSPPAPPRPQQGDGRDFSDVRGQEMAKAALVVAAAGGHNALLIGPPGSGKTMLARRVPTILPPLSFDDAVEATSIWSIAGLLKPGEGLLTAPPFRAPHHTISVAGLVGGGAPLRPGEISLAHRGCLFMDELPEFGRSALEALRQPLEDGEVNIVRARERATLPARFMLIGAMNPCPCGHANDAEIGRCSCTAAQKLGYLARVSGPILDRFDLHIEAPALKSRELVGLPSGQPSSALRERVERARARQRERYEPLGISCNAQLRGPRLDLATRAAPSAVRALCQAIEAYHFSARAHDRIWRVARTIADLEGSGRVEAAHIHQASQLRCLDKPVEGSPGKSGGVLQIARHKAAQTTPDAPSGEQGKEAT